MGRIQIPGGEGMRRSYTKKQVVLLLLAFGEHVGKKCTGTKVDCAGELFQWARDTNNLEDPRKVTNPIKS